MQTIVETLIGQLPDDLSYLTPDDLLQAGYPPFLVARINVELEHNLAESVALPSSDWANMHADSVQDAWGQFLDAIRAETRIPISYIQPVLETCIEDLLDLLSQPRTSIPDYLFGSLDTLSRDQLASRVGKTGVYPTLMHSLVRYCDRKKLDQLTKSEASRIIKAVDDKLTETYTALNWGQLLSPLFELMPTGVDADLLARFFNDRGMKSEARAFAASDSSISKSLLIEFLSQPFADYDDEILEDETMKIDELTKGPVIEEIVEDESEAEEAELNEVENNEMTKVSEVEETLEAETEDVADEPVPIWKRFAPEETEEDDPFAEVISTPVAPSFNLDTPESSGGSHPPVEETESEPLINLYSQDAEDDPRAARIFDLMADLKSEFIDNLFGGDENAYYAAVMDIAKYDTYAEAGRYIKKEILDRNRVDLYSDDAVLFLDRIQTYFVEHT
jgi:hypothetical protein